jgi:hypothetical protein
MHNPAHAAAVAEIESITADYCAGGRPGVGLAPATSDNTPIDRAAGMHNVGAARQYIANCYQITGVPLGVRDATDQATWAQMNHDQRVAHLTLYFNLRPRK